jgi:hypothetical protein
MNRSIGTGGIVASLLAVLLGVLGPAGAARAEPFAGSLQQATFSVRVMGTDGRLHSVVIEATKMTGASATPQAAWVTVQLATCTAHSCSAPAQYSKAIDPAAFTIAPDASEATLVTTFAKSRLNLTWTSDSQLNIDTFVNAGPGTQLAAGNGSNAATDGRFLGTACSGSGSIRSGLTGTDSAPSADGAREPRALPAGFRHVNGRAAKCAR